MPPGFFGPIRCDFLFCIFEGLDELDAVRSDLHYPLMGLEKFKAANRLVLFFVNVSLHRFAQSSDSLVSDYDVSVPHEEEVQLWHIQGSLQLPVVKEHCPHTVHKTMALKTNVSLQLSQFVFFYRLFRTLWKKEFCSFGNIFKTIFLSRLKF